MLGFFTYTEVNRGPLKLPLRSRLWTAVHSLSTPAFSEWKSTKSTGR